MTLTQNLRTSLSCPFSPFFSECRNNAESECKCVELPRDNRNQPNQPTNPAQPTEPAATAPPLIGRLIVFFK